MVILVTSDNVRFYVEPDIVERSVVIKNMLEDLGQTNEDVPLPNVTSTVFNKVLDYCYHHRADPKPDDGVRQPEEDARNRTTPLTSWDEKFFEMEQDLLFDVILAANYLDIKSLLDDGCKAIAKMIVGKTTEEIRTLFNITNDFTPEEELRVKRENQWAEEP